ncbi:hypothetical protein NC652_037853 [Populus alba x Populus x berolinensis]|nr:hypothetical protein NC652_037853 [Populus alba x Populus x berolinensis]
MMPPKRKKWTEVEEKTLIEKYGEMVSDGTLAKMKSREKNYKPIALYVNSVHHVRDPMDIPLAMRHGKMSSTIRCRT